MGFSYKKNIGKGYQMKHGNSAFRMGNATEDIKVSDIVDFNQPGMAEYKQHVANTPQFEEGGGIISKIKTLGQRFVHNVTGPSNPNLVTGTVPVGPKISDKLTLLKAVGNMVSPKGPEHEIIKPLDTERIASYKIKN